MKSYEKAQEIIKDVTKAISMLYSYQDVDDLIGESNLYFCLHKNSTSRSEATYREGLFNHLKRYVLEQHKNAGVDLETVAYVHIEPSGVDTRKVLEDAFKYVLEPMEYRILAMRYLDSMSVEDISNKTGYNQQSVQVSICQSKRKIRDEYSEDNLRVLLGLLAP